MKDDYYIDSVTRTIIATLSDHIAAAVAGKIDDKIGERITKVDENTKALLEANNSEIKTLLEDSLERNRNSEEQNSFIKDALEELQKSMLNKDNEKIDSAVIRMDGILSGLADKMESSFETMENKITTGNEMAKTLIQDSTEDISSRLKDFQTGKEEDVVAIKSMLEDIKLAVQDGGDSKNIVSIVTKTESILSGLSDKMESSFGTIEDKITGDSKQVGRQIQESTEEIKSRLKDILAKKEDDETIIKSMLEDIKRILQEGKESQTDFLNGFIEKIENRLIDVSREIGNSMESTESKIGEIEGKISAYIEKSGEDIKGLLDTGKEEQKVTGEEIISFLKSELGDIRETILANKNENAGFIKDILENDLKNAKKLAESFLNNQVAIEDKLKKLSETGK